MREATSRVVLAELFERGATVTAYDPVAMEEARRIFGDEPRLQLCRLTQWPRWKAPMHW
jgi:UDPglucose 6-dehydrogenase